MNVLSHVLCSILLIVCSTVNSSDLTGVVLDDTGSPIKGARVDISTATPIDGPDLFCPSCYLDCSKWAKSDSAGRFVLSTLDERLKFRLVVTAPTMRTHRTELIDLRQSPIEVRMQRLPDDIPPSRLLHGQVLSKEGVAISGALIEPAGAKAADRHWRGTVNASSAVTDDSGKFVMVLGDDFVGIDVQVTAFGYPGTLKQLLSPGDTTHEITLNAGCKVTGRLKGRKATALPTIAAVQLDRSNTDRPFLKAVLAQVNDDGHFEFPQLPPKEYYAIFSLVNLQDDSRIVIPTSLFLSSDDGKTLDLGTINTASSNAIRGKLVTQDSALPNNLNVSLRREPAWDRIQVPVNNDGSFVINNLPPESYEVIIDADTLEIDFTNFHYQPMGRNSFGISSFDDSVVEIPLRKSSSNTSGSRRTVTGRFVTSTGTPVGRLTVYPTSSSKQKLSKAIETKSDGTFSFAGLPGEPFDLLFYSSDQYHYPKTAEQEKLGHTILFPGRLTVYPEQSDLQIIYDSNLVTGLPVLNARLGK